MLFVALDAVERRCLQREDACKEKQRNAGVVLEEIEREPEVLEELLSYKYWERQRRLECNEMSRFSTKLQEENEDCKIQVGNQGIPLLYRKWIVHPCLYSVEGGCKCNGGEAMLMTTLASVSGSSRAQQMS